MKDTPSWAKEAAEEIRARTGGGAFDERFKAVIATIISKHAPAETVNERANALLIPLLLEYLRHPSLDGHPVRQKMREDLKMLCESAPASLEKEALDIVGFYIGHMETFHPGEYTKYVSQARDVLRRAGKP